MTPCYDWIDGTGIKVLVYHCPYEYFRKYFTVNRTDLKLGDKFTILKPRIVDLIYMGESELAKEWKKIDNEMEDRIKQKQLI